MMGHQKTRLQQRLCCKATAAAAATAAMLVKVAAAAATAWRLQRGGSGCSSGSRPVSNSYQAGLLAGLMPTPQAGYNTGPMAAAGVLAGGLNFFSSSSSSSTVTGIDKTLIALSAPRPAAGRQMGQKVGAAVRAIEAPAVEYHADDDDDEDL